MREYRARGKLREIERSRAVTRAAKRRRRERTESWLDLLNLRLLPPLFGASLLAAAALLAVWLRGGIGGSTSTSGGDGNGTAAVVTVHTNGAAAWWVFAPVWLFLAALGLAVASGCAVWANRANRSSVLHDMWTPYRGVVRFLMEDVLSRSAVARVSGAVLYCTPFAESAKARTRAGLNSSSNPHPTLADSAAKARNRPFSARIRLISIIIPTGPYGLHSYLPNPYV